MGERVDEREQAGFSAASDQQTTRLVGHRAGPGHAVGPQPPPPRLEDGLTSARLELTDADGGDAVSQWVRTSGASEPVSDYSSWTNKVGMIALVASGCSVAVVAVRPGRFVDDD